MNSMDEKIEKPNNKLNTPHTKSGDILQVLDCDDTMNIIGTITEKYPEMKWLTGDVSISPERSIKAESGQTIGEKLFPNLSKDQLIEFNRTAVGILCLYWAYNGEEKDYLAFTKCQSDESTRLTKESFQELHKYTRKILQSEEDLEAMIIYTVINDLGKIQSVIDELQMKKSTDFAIENIPNLQSIEAIVAYAVKKDLSKIEEITKLINEKVEKANIDHDKLLLEGLENYPDISPSYNQLKENYQNHLLTGLRGEFNLGQYIQAENIPASLMKLDGIDQRSLDFYIIHFLFDLAGAAGQFVQNGSAVITEATYQAFQKSIISLSQKGLDYIEIYDYYLKLRADDLELNTEIPLEKAITRVCCMLRYSTPEKAMFVKETFENLPQNIKSILELELNQNGINDGFGSLIYYSPAILVNLQNSMKENPSKGLELGLKTLARIYQEARIKLKNREGNGCYTIMASNIAKIVAKNPTDIDKYEIDLESVGDDATINLIPFSTIDETLFDNIDNISDIPGNTILPIGMGGGSDCVQAAQLGHILQKSGKQVPAVISVRTQRTSSQGSDGKIGEDRTPENSQKISNGVFLIDSDTKMKGRSVEPLIANDIPTYLILITEGINLTEQIKSVNKHLGGVDTIIGVDTGGDALYSTTEEESAKATPDQDILVLKAIDKLQGIHTLSAEIAVGVDTPTNGEEILSKADAKYFEPNNQQIEHITTKYKERKMDGTDDKYFGKTPLSWQKALQGQTGLQVIDLPTRVVVDKKNPWRTFVNIQTSTKGIFFMKTSNHLKAIGN